MRSFLLNSLNCLTASKPLIAKFLPSSHFFNKNRFLKSFVKSTKKLNISLLSAFKLTRTLSFKSLFFIYNQIFDYKIPSFSNYRLTPALSKFFFKKIFYTSNILNIFKLNKLD
jgi:hypothetical protein